LTFSKTLASSLTLIRLGMWHNRQERLSLRAIPFRNQSPQNPRTRDANEMLPPAKGVARFLGTGYVGQGPSRSPCPGQRPRCYTQFGVSLSVPAGRLTVAQQLAAGKMESEGGHKSRRDVRKRDFEVRVQPSLRDEQVLLSSEPSDEIAGLLSNAPPGRSACNLCVTTSRSRGSCRPRTL
jgi:hypothetical protein